MKRSSKKGFTLAELLIVIAIIAVLVAIMIPVFGAQLDKARAAQELANVRAKYSELVANAMLGAGNDLTPATDPTGKVTIKFTDLQAAEAYGAKTKISLSKGAAAPTTKPTYDATKMPTETTGDLYITVVYGDYFGSFKIDSDVIIDFTTGA